MNGYRMSKKFKDKTCPYCGGAGISTTGDHIFARAFFLNARRANLPQVAACDACNDEVFGTHNQWTRKRSSICT
jgi:hypothetical protein